MKTNPRHEPRITVAEVAGSLRITEEHALGFLPVDAVGPDWQGRRSVSIRAAAEAVDAYRAGVAKHDAAVDAHERYLATRGRDRAEAMQKAAQAAAKEAAPKDDVQMYALVGPEGPLTTQKISGPQRHSTEASRLASAAAGETFDREHPALGLHDWLQTKEGREYA